MPDRLAGLTAAHTLDLLERTANLGAIALEGAGHPRTIALEYRSSETRGHTDRVVRLSETLGGVPARPGQARHSRRGAAGAGPPHRGGVGDHPPSPSTWWCSTTSGGMGRVSGEATPYGARLFSVVDVYDAPTSERPYKPAWTHQAALAEVRRLSGLAFDPALVAAFEAITGG